MTQVTHYVSFDMLKGCVHFVKPAHPKEEKISRARKVCLTKATAMKTSHADWASIEQGRNSEEGFQSKFSVTTIN